MTMLYKVVDGKWTEFGPDGKVISEEELAVRAQYAKDHARKIRLATTAPFLTGHCTACGKEAEVWRYSRTLVGYGSPVGHDHDDNCRTYQWKCECGAENTIKPRLYCAKCDWEGKSYCFCDG